MKETTSEKSKIEEKSNPDGSINFIHHFSPSTKNHRGENPFVFTTQKHEIGPSDLFFEVFLILVDTKPLTSTTCLYCLYAMDLFCCSPGEWKPIVGSGVPSQKSSGKNITSFRAAKNPLLWRHNDLKFNLFRAHLYEKSTMIHLK